MRPATRSNLPTGPAYDHHHAIVGFGLFVLLRRLSVGEAWEAFDVRNGAPSITAMWERVTRYAVEAAYGKCAATKEHSLPALEAAHNAEVYLSR